MQNPQLVFSDEPPKRASRKIRYREKCYSLMDPFRPPNERLPLVIGAPCSGLNYKYYPRWTGNRILIESIIQCNFLICQATSKSHGVQIHFSLLEFRAFLHNAPRFFKFMTWVLKHGHLLISSFLQLFFRTDLNHTVFINLKLNVHLCLIRTFTLEQTMNSWIE